MSTVPRTPADHDAEAERLLDATEETPAAALLLAICHALLATAPRSARKRTEPRPARRHGGPNGRWLFGDDQDGQR